MRKFIAVLIGAVLLASTSASMAHGAYRSHYPYRSFHGGYGHYHGHHGDAGAWLVGGLIGGLIIGDWLSRPRYYYAPEPAAVVYRPATPAFTHCLPTTGEGWVNGRRALYSGTMCYDAYGRSYILNNTVRFEGYLQ